MTRFLISWFFIGFMTHACEPEGDHALRPDPAQIARIPAAALRGQATPAQTMAQAPFRLRHSLTLVCDGVPPEARASCPVDESTVADVIDSDEGVMLRMRSEVGSAQDVARRVHCYRALASIDAIGTTDTCAVDVPDADVTVRAHRGRVVVELSGRKEDRLAALRSTVRERLEPRMPVVSELD